MEERGGLGVGCGGFGKIHARWDEYGILMKGCGEIQIWKARSHILIDIGAYFEAKGSN